MVEESSKKHTLSILQRLGVLAVIGIVLTIALSFLQ